MIRNAILITGSAPINQPVEIIFSLLHCKCDIVYEVPKCVPLENGWGKISITSLTEREAYPIPSSIDFMWLALNEEKVYSIEDEIDTELINKEIEKLRKSDEVVYIIVGYAPYGFVCLWLHNRYKTIIIYKGYAKVVLEKSDRYPFLTPYHSIAEYCACQLKRGRRHLPSRNLFDNYMKRYIYRYIISFDKMEMDNRTKDDEGIFIFNYIEESLYDGTYDKLHDGGLLKYHLAGKPKKLAIKWHIGKSEYSAFFWFEEEPIREVFDKFYGAHPDTKTDFIIRIDAENRKYELALYRYGLKEPQIIPENVYQLLVFKNKFENYRSDNYNQERGAWIW